MTSVRLVLGMILVAAVVSCGSVEDNPVAIDPSQPLPTEVAESDFVTTESGLKYFDIAVGTGVSPSAGKLVTVHYIGWLTSGLLFDTSIVNNAPFTFTIGVRQVILGWDEGVMSMKVGGIRQLKIPPTLAYGESGRPPTIPGNATLIFEVQLLAAEE